MLDYSKLPERLRTGTQLYIEKGVPPGDFLTAVIQNNLVETFVRADNDMAKKIYEIITWFYWEVPSACWGSETKMNKWIYKKDQEYRFETEKI